MSIGKFGRTFAHGRLQTAKVVRRIGDRDEKCKSHETTKDEHDFGLLGLDWLNADFVRC